MNKQQIIDQIKRTNEVLKAIRYDDKCSLRVSNRLIRIARSLDEMKVDVKYLEF